MLPEPEATQPSSSPSHLRYVQNVEPNTYDNIIFIHFDDSKRIWCLFDYNLQAPRPDAISGYNPTTTPLAVDTSKFSRTAEYFRPDREAVSRIQPQIDSGVY